MNILIADDEISMLKILCAYFKRKISMYLLQKWGRGFRYFYKNKIDLAILDWMMPIIDGIEVCKEIKENSNTKVLMLTAKSQSEDEIEALNIGADEYIKNHLTLGF